MSQTDEELAHCVKDRIEKNRLKAIAIKQSKLMSHPYAKNATAVSIDKTTIKIGAVKYKDTGSGFLLPEDTETEKPITSAALECPPIFQLDRPTCEKCQKTFATSWLFNNFECNCCDECKNEEEHELITKTEALNMYLLKDCDLEKREPPLKYITRKNPHNVRWGEMKLYLQTQVEKRALEVWGCEEQIEKEREKREEKRAVAKTKKYHKQLKELRMSMRSSMYDRTSARSHQHEFGSEIYNKEKDNYTRKCQSCTYEETFEKM